MDTEYWPITPAGSRAHTLNVRQIEQWQHHADQTEDPPIHLHPQIPIPIIETRPTLMTTAMDKVKCGNGMWALPAIVVTVAGEDNKLAANS
ncbi:uncharacterized protein LOC132796494 isoform X2 [Drosophila nasuta]|uniref:uncharacterized protein LOC132796494 isoform X2 n=1 Tax=Drosophila nasuta TaxID=42062 RepID=UPI00295E2472|nr:uncharacterized protein LOC132796494 isoform X2 [Drosophila nasuta]